MKKFTTEEIRDLLNRVMIEEIGFTEMVEIMNEMVNERVSEMVSERVNEAENPCVEDIPKRKFKNGDKVRIKEGISSKTHDKIGLSFVEEMDDLIGKKMTVDRYPDGNNYVKCEGIDYSFHEDWIEPYEELKKCDLVIFWDDDKRLAVVRFYEKLNESEEYFQHKDQNGFDWKNAIKFESKEQYERLIKGEI